MLRKSILWSAFLTLLTAAIVSTVGPVLAFTLSPMVIKLRSDGGVQTIKVKNPSSEPIDMQLQLFSWEESVDLAALKPTNDLLAMPPIFRVEPGGEQVIRIALRRPLKADVERTYRIVIGEIPSEVNSEEGLGFNLSVSIPLFVRPRDAAAFAEWTIENNGDSPHLVLANEGNSYLKVGRITLADNQAGKAVLLELDGGYVFGGDSRSWPISSEFAQLKGPVTVKTESNIGLLEATISFPES